MPPKSKKGNDASPSKARWDTSPGNPNGWRPMSEWSGQENQRCIHLIATMALENRSRFYTDEHLKPWSYNGGSDVNNKLKSLLAKICKDHQVEMPAPPTGRSPSKKRDKEKVDEPTTPIKKAKKAKKEALPSKESSRNVSPSPSSSHSQPVTPRRKRSGPGTIKYTAATFDLPTPKAEEDDDDQDDDDGDKQEVEGKGGEGGQDGK